MVVSFLTAPAPPHPSHPWPPLLLLNGRQVAFHRASADASIEVYTEAVSRNSSDPVARISLGMALLRQERIPEALDHLAQAVEVRVLPCLGFLGWMLGWHDFFFRASCFLSRLCACHALVYLAAPPPLFFAAVPQQH